MSQKSWIARVANQLARHSSSHFFSRVPIGRGSRSITRKLGHSILLAVSLLSCESFATQVEALQLAISQPQVALTIPLISKIEVVNIYHCPDCYDIRVSGLDNTAQIEMNFHTAINQQNELEATLIDTERIP